MPEGCMQMMQAAREQDAELEHRLQRMKQATASEEKLEDHVQRHDAHGARDDDEHASRPEGETYAAQGRVESVDPERGTVTIDHEDIPGLMKAMTVTFEVADRAIIEDVSVGQAIEFRIRKEDGRYVVTEVHISD